MACNSLHDNSLACLDKILLDQCFTGTETVSCDLCAPPFTFQHMEMLYRLPRVTLIVVILVIAVFMIQASLFLQFFWEDWPELGRTPLKSTTANIEDER